MMNGLPRGSDAWTTETFISVVIKNPKDYMDLMTTLRQIRALPEVATCEG